MAASKVTIRSLARQLGLSVSTVSDALRGTGRISSATAKRVRQAAKQCGYRINPLTTALMSDIRRSRATTFRGVLAAVEIYEPDRGSHGPFPRQIVSGARSRARELGFDLAEFLLGSDGLTLRRLDSVLQSRGIRGVMLLPAWHTPDLGGLDWSRYAGVYTDCVIARPHLHLVCPDHYRSMAELLQRLYQRGYRRPGLVLEQGRDERLQFRQGAAFRVFQESQPDVKPVPTLIVPQHRAEDFLPWFKRHQPDVVLSHQEDTVNWIRSTGRRVPEDHGFVHLNTLGEKTRCAGLDLQPETLGARAAELVIGQLYRNETGIPDWPTSTMLEARWVEGPTVRTAAAAAE